MTYVGRVVNGAGGASKAFLRNGEIWRDELEKLLGYRPHPGTLNVRLSSPFDFSREHVKGQLTFAKPPDVRLYPVNIEGIEGHVIRFNHKRYSPAYIGVIASVRLRDHVGSTVTVRHR